jgi:hypothetical protein
VDEAFRRKAMLVAGLIGSLGHARVLKGLMAGVMRASSREYSDEDRRMMTEQFMAAPPELFSTILRAYCSSRPPASGQLSRCLVVIAEDDPVAPPDEVARALAQLGIPPTHVRRLVGSGHFPQAGRRAHPGWTQRNLSDLVSCIGSMLRASSEGTPLPTEVASTLVGSTDP